MSEPTGWGKRNRYRPDPGVEIDKDNQLFDVVEWRKATQQKRNGQTHLRGYDPLVHEDLESVLEQLKEMNFHLRIITGEKYDH